MLIDLSLLEAFAAAIVLVPSDIQWTNQTGGISCDHPVAEGLLVPLPLPGWLLDPSAVDPLLNVYQHQASPTAARNVIAGWLLQTPYDEVFEAIEWSDYWGEAWVPVRVAVAAPEPFDHFRGLNAIITYENSD